MASVVLPHTAPRWSLLSAHAPGTTLATYVDGELTAAEALRVERHLAGCGACHAVVARHLEVGDAVRALPRLPVPEALGRDFRRRLLSAAR